MLNTSKTSNSKNNVNNDPFLLKEKADAFFIVAKDFLSAINTYSYVQIEKCNKEKRNRKKMDESLNAIRKHYIVKSH